MNRPKKESPDVAFVKFQLCAGKATPTPPVATILGPRGVNTMDFCKLFNEQTKSMDGEVVTVVVSIFRDRTFSFVIKSPPVSSLIKSAIGLTSGSKEPGRSVVAQITMDKILQIAKRKLADTTADTLDDVVSMIIGSARSMGIDVIED